MRGFNKFAAMSSLILLTAACTPNKSSILNAEMSEADNAPTENQVNIVGGKVVSPNSNLSRSVVLVVNVLTQEVCSAALIGGNFAVTAAHCVDEENPENMYVFFGTKPNKNSERRQVLKAKASPYYELRKNEDSNTSDIAVIKFNGNGLPKGYESVAFLQDESVLKKGATAIILGYGNNDAQTQTGAGQLRFTTLQVSDPTFSATEILLDQSKGSGACHGDSGGPAFVYLADNKGRGKFYMWGVANHGSKDDVDNLCNKSVIYTNATLFLTWIDLVKQSL